MFQLSSFKNRFAKAVAGIALLSICTQSWVAGRVICEEVLLSTNEVSITAISNDGTGESSSESADCCCLMAMNECCCAGCDCTMDRPQVPVVPAIPINSQSVCEPSLVCWSWTFPFPEISESKSLWMGSTVEDSLYSTAQETCVLLSRFTC